MLIGIDIVDINRIKSVIQRTPRFLQRLYTTRELEYCFQKQNPYPSLAARYAAREAFRKLDNVFVSGICFQDVEIVIGPGGKPELMLYGRAIEKAKEIGIRKVAVSLSHAKEQAIAVVIAQRE